jgi:phosphate-selective porin
MGERQAYGVDGGEVERELAGDAANAVGAEELLHRYKVLGTRF